MFAGLKSFVSLQSTRKLGENTSASLGLSWHPKAGVGLHITSSRQLSASVDADVTWVVGPAGAEGVQFGIQRRGEKVTVVGRLEVREPFLQGAPLCRTLKPACFCTDATIDILY